MLYYIINLNNILHASSVNVMYYIPKVITFKLYVYLFILQFIYHHYLLNHIFFKFDL